MTDKMKIIILIAGYICTLNVSYAMPIVINEIMQNPAAVSDANGEWFELFNTTGSPIDINGWSIQDNDIDSHIITNGGSLYIPAMGFLVLGRNADSGTNGGVLVDYEYSGIFLANGADELVLLDNSPIKIEIDRVEWDGGPAFPDPTGSSMELINPSLDNNVGANWMEATTSFGGGDLGTPGAKNSVFVSVSEPNGIALLGLSLIGLGLSRRRSFRQNNEETEESA